MLVYFSNMLALFLGSRVTLCAPELRLSRYKQTKSVDISNHLKEKHKTGSVIQYLYVLCHHLITYYTLGYSVELQVNAYPNQFVLKFES